MIPMPSGVRVWIAAGHTDMRRGMQGLALQVQEQLRRDPHGGDLYIFRGRRGDLAKILWHDGLGLSLYAKRLDRGKFIWPSANEGAVSISAQIRHAERNHSRSVIFFLVGSLGKDSIRLRKARQHDSKYSRVYKPFSSSLSIAGR